MRTVQRWRLLAIGALALLAGYLFIEQVTPGRSPSRRESSSPFPPPKTGVVKGEEAELSGNETLEEQMEFFKSLPFDEFSTHQWIDFAFKLAKESPDEGFRWLIGLPATEQTKLAMAVFSRTLYAYNSALVSKFLEEVLASNSGLRNSFCAGFLEAASEHSLENAYAILDKISRTGSEKDSLIRGLAAKIHQKGGSEEIIKLAKKFPQQTDPIFFGNALYSVWKNDALAAQEHLDQMPNEKFVAESCNLLAYKYGKDQPESAKGWVYSLPNGSVKDSSSAGLARSLSRTEPLTAVEISLAIQDHHIREGALSTLIGPAIAKDFDATKRIISTSDLPNPEKKRWIDFADENVDLWR